MNLTTVRLLLRRNQRGEIKLKVAYLPAELIARELQVIPQRAAFGQLRCHQGIALRHGALKVIDGDLRAGRNHLHDAIDRISIGTGGIDPIGLDISTGRVCGEELLDNRLL